MLVIQRLLMNNVQFLMYPNKDKKIQEQKLNCAHFCISHTDSVSKISVEVLDARTKVTGCNRTNFLSW